MANALHTATKSLIDEGDVGGSLLLLFGITAGATDAYKRRANSVTPNEAEALVAAANALPLEQRHIVAAAIARNMATREIQASPSTELRGEDGPPVRPASDATAALNAFVAANTPTADERAIGQLLGATDGLLNAAFIAIGSVRDGKIDSSFATSLDTARQAFETALAPPVPSSLRNAVLAHVRATIHSERDFPADFANYPSLAALHRCLNP